MTIEEIKVQDEKLRKAERILSRIKQLENLKNEYIKDASIFACPSAFGVDFRSKQAIEFVRFGTITALHFEIEDLKKRLEEI